MTPERDALERLVEALAARFGAPEEMECAPTCVLEFAIDSDTTCDCGAAEIAEAWGRAESLIDQDNAEEGADGSRPPSRGHGPLLGTCEEATR